MQTLRYKIDEEARVNSEIETYLRQHHQVREKYPQMYALLVILRRICVKYSVGMRKFTPIFT